VKIQEPDFILKWQSQVKKGLLEYIILLVLDIKTCYGYELIQEIETRTHLELAEGTIYPLLNRLKAENLVKSKWVEMDRSIPRKYYEVTLKGKEYKKKMKNYLADLQTSFNKLEK
jgi:PadR family transcriptional regulator PadR